MQLYAEVMHVQPIMSVFKPFNRIIHLSGTSLNYDQVSIFEFLIKKDLSFKYQHALYVVSGFHAPSACGSWSMTCQVMKNH